MKILRSRSAPATGPARTRKQTARAAPETAAPSPRRAGRTAPVSADLAGLWAKLIEAVGRVSPFTRSYLVDANPVSFEKNILTIGFDPEFEDHLGLVDNARNHTLLQTKLGELGHANAQVKFVKSEASAVRAPQSSPTMSAVPTAPRQNEGGASASSAPAAKGKPAPVPFSKNDFKNDPLIQKALEIFKGQIVEVRA